MRKNSNNRSLQVTTLTMFIYNLVLQQIEGFYVIVAAVSLVICGVTFYKDGQS